jgi:uncharacterized OB-fold protein
MSDEQFFWDGADQARLLAQRCSDCRHLRHPPLPMCPHCQSLRWTEDALSGRGVIRACIQSRHPTLPDQAPRTVVLVELDEGLRLVGNLTDASLSSTGTRVQVFFPKTDGPVLVHFRSLDEELA